MNETILLESQTARESAINDVMDERMDNIFSKVKVLSLLPDDMHVTVEMVSNYYEVSNKTIESLIKEHKGELIIDGYKVLKGSKLKEFKLRLGNPSNLKFTSVLAFIPRRAILRIGMLLRDSEIAEKIRENLLLYESELYADINNSRTIQIKKHEKNIKTYLEFSFGKEDVRHQVRCNNYLIDFVLFNNIAIEVDEHGHTSYNKNNEKLRTDTILNSGYKLIRFNPHKQKPYELIIEISKIIKKSNTSCINCIKR